MKISIITVSFNAADTISDTIRSVQAQSYNNIEHIIIDGNSTDGTQDTVKRMADLKTVFISEPDCGLYDAMNKGIDRATGEVVGILNADDYFASAGALACVATQFSHHGEVEAVLGDIAFIDGQQVITRRYDSGRFKPDRTRWGLMPAHPGMYMKRSAYNQIGPYRIDMKIAADFDFVVRAFTCARLPFVHLPEVLVHMRPGGASTESWKSRLTINREVVQACRDNGIYTNLAMVMSKYPLKMMELIR
jgi:glycosyltransferase involved in cell wall biosynthesis|tara:strand:- start:4519 stop:5262 length:744 start_codon:yes stop_codon:yes gene_type:complete